MASKLLHANMKIKEKNSLILSQLLDN